VGSFGDSPWAKEGFSKNYLEKADIYIVERRKMFRVVTSFYDHFLKGEKGISIADLGCGDGVLSEELLKIDTTITGVLIDGSETMLQKARKRLQAYRGLDFMKASFEELLRGDVTLPEFDFCFSSQAIHHLDMGDKMSLFRYLNARLRDNGSFVNVDVVRAPSEGVQEWYYVMWREWMRHMFEALDITDEVPEDVIMRYKSPASMNTPDTLEAQLEALKEAGFKDVDCYYKNGIFAVFGGRKR
jgi:tRNA (cmo5U34)-methyltransferase